MLRVGSLAAGIVLARLLSPTDYGVYAIALVVLTLLQSFNELGVSLALVRWAGDVRQIAATVMTVSIGSSAILYAITYVAAPAFCGLLGAPQAIGVVRLMCVAVVIDGVATVPVGLLNRTFMQRQRFAGDAASFLASTTTTILLAALGAGPLSFAWGRVAGGLLATVVYVWLSPVRVWPGWNRSQVGPLLRFGLPLAGASLLVLSISNVDNLIVGGALSQASLGLYLLAFNQSSWPLTVFSEAARRVSLAGFSRLSHDLEALGRAFARGFALLMAATVPVCVLLACYAEPLIRVVYGARWVPAAVVLPPLAFLGLIRVALFVCYDVLVSLARSRLLVELQLLWLVVLVPALVVGVRADGIRGAGLAHAAVAGLVVAPAFFVVLRRLGLRPGRVLRSCGRPALGGILIAASTVVVRGLVVGALPQLLVGGLAAALVYLPVVAPLRTLLPAPWRTRLHVRSGRHARA